jgi:hypothetical protein
VIFATLSDGVIIALVVCIGGLAATASPILLAHMTNMSNLKNKQQEWDRQDELAERAERHAAAQLLAQHAVVDGLHGVNDGLGGVNEKLVVVEHLTKVTHDLVNSDKTTELRRQRDDKAATLALMREIVALKRSAGQAADAKSLHAIERVVQEIGTLDQTILDRRVIEQHTATTLQNIIADEEDDD